MSHLDPERLALVAVGEPLTDAEQEHVATCDVCSIELAELEHTVAVGRSTMTLGELETPPERVWDRILDEVRSPQPAASEVGAPAPAGSPPPSAAPADAPPVADEQPKRRGGLRGGRMLFALAASIAAVLAIVGVWSFVRAPQSVEIASATLAAFPDHPGAAGTAQVIELSDGERTLTVNVEDFDESDGFREVWLITADASALVSLGELDGKKGTFVVPADVDLRDYVLVDISQEPLDGDPTHSGDSIVRGQLEFS
ncbi:anti-sigma factor [Microbacterium trichothecenolyticum]|uniref:Anti-sigma-K factor rskA n=1 Tax=Microbacterium trichothecenolyticum TaxID=69370 RepID=A0A0M2HLA2_MICTR|nr:anti-sigma factor [Microbacterium trichothecenolyticum]KJL45668.1 Anti-sigma-K factor rskA [Microbacterium trichothecenolyticum]